MPHGNDEMYEKRIAELEAELNVKDAWINSDRVKLTELQHQNALLNEEYKKVWDVLRTYNPIDLELEYIGFKTIEVIDE